MRDHFSRLKFFVKNISIYCSHLFSSLKIADINLTSEAKVKLEPGINLPFTYQVNIFK